MTQLAEPTDATFLAQKERIGAAMEKWKGILPLQNWEITPIYSRVPIRNEPGESWKTVAETRTDWRYLQASVQWNVVEVMDESDEKLDMYVRHEFLHILLDRVTRYARGEYPGNVIDQAQVEETTSILELAIHWAYEAGIAEGREQKEKESLQGKPFNHLGPDADTEWMNPPKPCPHLGCGFSNSQAPHDCPGPYSSAAFVAKKNGSAPLT